MTGVGEPRLDAERHDEQRRAAGLGGERLDRRRIEMVVVVVRDQHRIDARQIGRGEARWDRPLRAGERQRRDAFRQHRIGQQGDAAHLQQHAGMADPGRGRLHRRAGGGVAAQELDVGRLSRRRGGRLGRQAVAHRIELPLQESAESARGEVQVVVLEAAVAMMRRRRDRCRRRGRHGFVSAHEGRHQGEQESESGEGLMAHPSKHRPSLHCRPVPG